MKKKFIVDLISLLLSLSFMIIAYLLKDKSFGIIFWSLAFVIGGRAKAIEGVKKTIEDKSLNVEFLMILSALAAFFVGNYQEGAILIFIFALSGVLEEYVMSKSSKALESLMKLVPEQAIRIKDNREYIVHINELEIEDIVLIKVGQQVPADGIIIKGTTTLDESMITGEYMPVSKNINDAVLSGTINQESAIYVRVTSSAENSSMQRIVDFIKKAQGEQTKTEVGIQKFEKYYVYMVLVSAILLMLIPPLFNIWDFNTALYKSIVLLVVASPCALVASVSPVMLSTMSRATREGVLMKGSIAIQKLALVNTLFLDKTGTVTQGHPDVFTIDFYTDEENEISKIIYHIEKQSNHPLAKSVVKYLADKIDVGVMNFQTTEIKGKGVTAIINNQTYFIGKTSLNDNRVKLQQEKGYTTAEVTVNNELVAIITFTDQIRSNMKSTIENIQHLGIKTIMVTGDNAFNAKTVSQKVGIEHIIANCLPEDKVAAIKKEKANSVVAMIGDGINDGPSLAVADVGIAMGSGSDVAMETANIVLMHNDIDKMPNIIKLTKKAKVVYTQNMIFSVLVILLLVATNIFGFVKLPLAVIFHEGSTILVILNGLRLLLK